MYQYRKPLIYIGRQVWKKHGTKFLRRLAEMCSITSRLTSNVSRHFWATISKYAGISVEIISEGLGNTALKTTPIYLDSFSDSVVNAASDTIANLLDN
jgi:site-specific recombinase XerD